MKRRRRRGSGGGGGGSAGGGGGGEGGGVGGGGGSTSAECHSQPPPASYPMICHRYICFRKSCLSRGAGMVRGQGQVTSTSTQSARAPSFSSKPQRSHSIRDSSKGGTDAVHGSGCPLVDECVKQVVAESTETKMPSVGATIRIVGSSAVTDCPGGSKKQSFHLLFGLRDGGVRRRRMGRVRTWGGARGSPPCTAPETCHRQ